MDPLKNNDCLQEVIQNAVDTAVKAIRNHRKYKAGSQKSSSALARSIATAAGSRRYPGSELPVPWWMLSPEFAMYHGVAAEVDEYYDASLPIVHKTEGTTMEEEQTHLMEEVARLNSRINALKIEHLERQRFVRSSRKRFQGFGLRIYHESYNFHRNSLYAVAARLQWCRNERDRMAHQLNAISRPDPEEMSRQMKAAMERHNDALAAEEAAMESEVYDASSDEEGFDEACSIPKPSKMPRLC